MKRELTNLKLTVISLDVQRILDRMENINNRINTLESSINQQSISVTMQEIQGTRLHVKHFSSKTSAYPLAHAIGHLANTVGHE